MLTKLRTEAPEVVEVYLLTKDFLHLQAGKHASVTDAHLCPEFLQCARKVSADSGWSQVFHAGAYMATRHLDNPQPPAPPREPIVYGALLTALRWTPQQFDAAAALNFPKPIAHRFTSRGGNVSAREAAYSVDAVNAWLTAVHQFAAAAPKAI